jgi:hypothetical protein
MRDERPLRRGLTASNFHQLAVLAIVVGCDRRDPAPAPPPIAPKTSDAALRSGGCTLPPIALRYPAPRRLVAIGDIHGDVAAARAALRTAGAIDEHDAWIGGELVVVQTGDLLDRGDDEQAILDLFAKLEPEAKQHGGALIALLGNHELMNAAGDFRYVTPGGKSAFGGHRGEALGPGGRYAKWLAQHAVVAIVGDTVFSHAGVLGDWTTQLDAANTAARCWLDGQAGGATDEPPALASPDSPVWTRALGADSVPCAAVTAALQKLGVKREVVAHTVQAAGINPACDGTVWRIDVGLAKLYGGPIEVLELGDSPKVLHGQRL